MAPGQRTVAAPSRRQPRARPLPLGSSTFPNRVTIEISAGPIVERGCHHDRHTDRQRETHALEVRQPGEVQAQRSPRQSSNPKPSTTCAVPWNMS